MRWSTGFLKFARPDELKLQPMSLVARFRHSDSVSPEAERLNVTIKVEWPDLPEINADPGHAVAGVAQSRTQCVSGDAQWRRAAISCRTAPRRRVEIEVEDTGIGIPPENLGSIFDLYFTTKEKGPASVYRWSIESCSSMMAK